MMEDTLLLKIALIGSIIGIALLFLLSNILKLPDSSLEQSPGKKARITGKIVKVGGNEQVTILEIEKECVLKAVMFEKADFNEGELVSIVGTVQEYQGEKELIVDKVEVIGTVTVG